MSKEDFRFEEQKAFSSTKKRKIRYSLRLKQLNISKRDYWIAKLEIAIEKKRDLFMNIRAQPQKAVYILEEMKKNQFKSPSEFINSLIEFHRKDLSREKSILCDYYGVNSNQELFEFFVKEAYTNLISDVKKYGEKLKKNKEMLIHRD